MNIIIALLIFSVIVIIHELGHFLLARFNGVEVTEFSLGMGPRLITLVKTDNGIRIKFFASSKVCETTEGWEHKTKYSIKILPFGGSCIMLGEDDVVESDRAFCKKNVYARMSIVFAGPFFNFLLAFVLSIIIIAVAGFDKPLVTSVQSGTPAEEAGLKEGDEIVKINNKKIHIDREISSYFTFHPLEGDENIKLVIKRDGEKITMSVKPQLVPVESITDGLAQGAAADKEEVQYSYKIGFMHGAPKVKGNAWQVLKYSVYEVKYWIVTTVESLGMLVTGKVGADEIAGPVGVVSMVGDLVNESKGFGWSTVIITLMYFSILLSANLGVMNLLPIPALDGGRLLFMIVEVIRRKPIAPEKEGIVTMIGFVLLMALMVFVMFNDISRLITG